MASRSGFLLRQALHDFRVSLLYRPALITAFLGALAPALTHLEARVLPIGPWLSGTFHWLCGQDVAAAQLVLTTIAGSMMTVLSLTYSVLLMALTLASMQFSPRILFGFLRDQVSQITLGLFVGTFAYCLLLLRLVHGAPEPFIPQLGLLVALGLALLSLGWLLYFIHHITKNIQANHLVARIADHTRQIIEEVFSEPLREGDARPESQRLAVPAQAESVLAAGSGYVQLVDEEGLAALARQHKVSLFLHRGPGEFVAAGTPLVSVSGGKPSAALAEACNGAFDLGELRTMQQDVEYGVRQIVDIALKAISPAVNDPSTAITCIDHLSVLVIFLASRSEPPQEIRDGDSVRVQLRRTTFRRVIDLAFNQIRQYGRTDMAVVLRLLRAFESIALSTRHAPYLDAVRRQARLLIESTQTAFIEGDRHELEARVKTVASILEARGVAW